MNGNEYSQLDKLFEAARKVPAQVNIGEVKKSLEQADKKRSSPSFFHRASYRSGWSLAIAASLALLVGLSLLYAYRSSTNDTSYQHRLVAMDTTPSHNFSLLDTYRGQPLSYWDTSSTYHVFSEMTPSNIHCIQTYLADTACHISIALELGKPDLINFFIADVTGKIIRDLLIDERQHQPDSSYRFDLCHLQSGRYELVVNTHEGDRIRKPIILN